MLNRQIQRRSSSPAGAPLRLPRRSGANDNRYLRLAAPAALRAGRLARVGRLALTVGKIAVRVNPYVSAALIAYELYDMYKNYVPFGWNNLGAWSLYQTCSANVANPAWQGGCFDRVVSSTVAFAALSCNTGVGIDNTCSPWTSPLVTNNTRSILIGKHSTLVPTSITGAGHYAYGRPNQGAFVRPTPRPQVSFLMPPPPEFWPFTDNPGLAAPGRLPAFLPATPYDTPQRKRTAPNRQTSNGTRPNYVRGRLDISSVPNDWSVSISSNGARNPAPQSHTMASPSALSNPARPNDKVKETKRKMPPQAVAALGVLSGVTEALDAVNALYDALPESARPRYRNTKHEKTTLTPQEKMKALYDHADEIDLNQALENLKAEAIEDLIYARLGMAGGEVSKAIGSSYGVGINSLLGKLSKSYYDAQESTRNRLDGEN